MGVTIESLGIDRFSVAERLKSIDDIRDSPPDQVSPDEVPEWFKPELDRRRAEVESDPGNGIPWRELPGDLSPVIVRK